MRDLRPMLVIARPQIHERVEKREKKAAMKRSSGGPKNANLPDINIVRDHHLYDIALSCARRYIGAYSYPF